MALINCPECGRRGVSDTAISCPDCAANIQILLPRLTTSGRVQQDLDSASRSLARWGLEIMKASAALLFIFILAGIAGSKHAAETRASVWQDARPVAESALPPKLVSKPTPVQESTAPTYKVLDLKNVGWKPDDRWASRVSIECRRLPTEAELRRSAEEIWNHRTVRELTIWFILPGMTSGSYCTAVFTPTGCKSFEISEEALLGTKWRNRSL